MVDKKMAMKAKMIKLPQSDSEDDWKVREDFRTLVEAKKICKDKERHKKVLDYAMQAKKNADEVVKDIIEEQTESEYDTEE
jgi:hypothetical protein